MRKDTIGVVSVTAILLALTSPCLAQPSAASQAGMVTLGLEVPRMTNYGRVFARPEAFPVQVVVSNGTNRNILLDPRLARQALSPSLAWAGSSLNTDVAWQDGVLVAGEPEARTLGDEAVPLAPGMSARLTVTLTRRDGEPLDEGDYTVRVTTTTFRRAILREDGAPFDGRVLVPDGVRTKSVTVALPRSAREQAEAHLVEASDAFARKDNDRLLAAYRAAAQAAPSLRSELDALIGVTYMGMRRYREAAESFERAFANTGLVPGDVIVDLAHAYLGAGDEANARRVLRQVGYSDDRVNTEITKLRGVLGQR